MTNTEIIIIVAVVIVILVVAIGIYARRKTRTASLQSKFGPEYARAVEEGGSRSKAEAELEQRRKRVSSLAIRPLAAEDRTRYLESWPKVQAEFVDDPKSAVVHADVLLGDVMKARGYPVGDFDQRAADVSVDHPVVVENYRAAHDIALKQAGGQATTEDLRQAMVHYRALFDELVSEPGEAPK